MMIADQRRFASRHVRFSAFICCFVLLLGGCGATVYPPKYVEQPTRVYLKMEERHSSIVLPRSETRFVEYSFGAWRWFAIPDTRWPVALGSLLGLMASTLQTVETVAMAPGEPPVFPYGRLIELRVDRRRADALRDELDARFRRHIDTLRYNPDYDLYFVIDDAHYHALSNCNQVTAEWVKRLGCRVDGLAMTNDFRLATSPERDRPAR